MKEKKNGSGLGRLKQRLTVENEGRLYFVLQLIFAFAQILLAYVAFGELNLSKLGILIYALFGALMMLMAGRGWQTKFWRGCGRTLSLVLSLFMLAASVIDVATTHITEPLGTAYATRTLGDYLGQFGAYLVRFVQPVLLMLYPTFAIAARRVGKQTDIVALRLLTWCNVFTATVTLLLSYESVTRLIYTNTLLFFSNKLLLILFLACTAASVFAVFMSYPYGTKWLMKKIEASRSGEAE